jgi:hypothetical protein
MLCDAYAPEPPVAPACVTVATKNWTGHCSAESQVRALLVRGEPHDYVPTGDVLAMLVAKKIVISKEKLAAIVLQIFDVKSTRKRIPGAHTMVYLGLKNAEAVGGFLPGTCGINDVQE